MVQVQGLSGASSDGLSFGLRYACPSFILYIPPRTADDLLISGSLGLNTSMGRNAAVGNLFILNLYTANNISACTPW